MLTMTREKEYVALTVLINITLSMVLGFSPQFVAPVLNVTIARGKDAKFTCVIKHLGGYRVGWVKADTKAIQAIHTHIITHNPRIQVSFDDHSTWHLIIRQATEDDQGPYMCQINTDPMISQVGYLEVLRSPEIDDSLSSSDVVVTEGDKATLKCVAGGHPQPSVTWVREDGNILLVSNGLITKPVSSWEGDVLELRKVSREAMGVYLCIARNNVPPHVSKRVQLQVHFHPIIHVPNQLIGAPYGSNVLLECNVEASPKPVTFWSNSYGDMIMTSAKYMVSEEHKSSGYAVKMSLYINHLSPKDIGSFTCVAKNSIGEVESVINVYHIQPATTATPRAIATAPFSDSEEDQKAIKGNPLIPYIIDRETDEDMDAIDTKVSGVLVVATRKEDQKHVSNRWPEDPHQFWGSTHHGHTTALPMENDCQESSMNLFLIMFSASFTFVCK